MNLPGGFKTEYSQKGDDFWAELMHVDMTKSREGDMCSKSSGIPWKAAVRAQQASPLGSPLPSKFHSYSDVVGSSSSNCNASALRSSPYSERQL
jgi:hypothetical protein